MGSKKELQAAIRSTWSVHAGLWMYKDSGE